MANKNKKQTSGKEPLPINTPWISQQKGKKTILVLSLAFGLWVGYQIISQSGEWGLGILYGLGGVASVWAVYLFMNWFHRFTRGTPRTDQDNEKKG